MNPNTKSTAVDPTYCPAAYATFYNKMFQHVVEAGKSSLNLAAEQNKVILASYHKALKGSAMPRHMLIDLAGQTFTNFLTIQKSFINLAVTKNIAVHDAAQCSEAAKTVHQQPNASETPVEKNAISLPHAFDIVLAN
jgi:hypothetical protein